MNIYYSVVLFMITEKLKIHPAFSNTQEIVDLCSPLKNLGITAFSHLRTDHEGSFSGLANNPEFMKNYLTKGYYNTDVHIKRNNYKSDNCLMWDAMECGGETQLMLQDAHDFSFKHIFTMIESHGEQCDYYHFGTDQTNPSINQTYINNIELLKRFIAYFNENMANSSELMKAYQIKFAVENDATGVQLKDSALLNNADEQRNLFLEAIGFDGTELCLTQRQQECANLLLLGCTAQEMALQLGLSRRTVEDYINRLKKKLNVHNKTELTLKLAKSCPSF
jgi:DNA-binding CsgD family transcriptional regulator